MNTARSPLTLYKISNMKIKASIPKGTRDFNAETFYKRQYISNTIKSVYELFGFEPIQTPTMENLDVLLGKYGDEGDQLIFKVLNNGNFLSKITDGQLKSRELSSIARQISEKGLRYDLTVPFARFVAQHRNDLTFPFKRYQMQPVWRADRPQKGRYREFSQCDADVIGTSSLLAESEFLQIYDMVFKRLSISNPKIQVNNRKILAGMAELIGADDDLVTMTVALDKLDKIGFDGVKKELLSNGFSEEQIEQLHQFISFKMDGVDCTSLKQIFSNSAVGLQGVQELEEVFQSIKQSTVNLNHIVVNITLARGLSYYTGMIFEVTIPESGIGSVSGGGRYDDLTSVFGFPDVSGVGISFGLDRLYDVMDQLDLWPEHLEQYKSPTRVLVVYLSADEQQHAIDFVEKLRYNGVQTELYLEPKKISKQIKYANDKGIPHVVIIGPEEVKSGEYQVKFMKSGNQQSLAPAYIINALRAR